MTEEERRHPYRYDRVLIESARVLDPQLAPVTVCLSGAHVEMLRNIVHYLDRPTTFVDTYEEDTYLVPDEADLENVATSVAELEYALMGNDNLPFGINERLVETYVVAKDGDGTFEANSSAVPAGYYWVVECAALSNFSGQRGTAFVSVVHAAGTFYAAIKNLLPQYERVFTPKPLTLSPGDYVRFSQGNVLDLDSLRCGVWGYKIKIP